MLFFGLKNVYDQQSHLHKSAWTRKKKPPLSAFAEGVLKGHPGEK